MNNFYTDVPAFLPGLISFVILLTIIFLVLSLAGLFFKKRSTMSGIMFILAFSAVCFFLVTPSSSEESIGSTLLLLGADYGIGQGIYGALCSFGSLVSFGHNFFVTMLAGIFGVAIDDPSLAFVNSGLFVMIVYVILFVLAFIFFNRKKKSHRIYSDYLS